MTALSEVDGADRNTQDKGDIIPFMVVSDALANENIQEVLTELANKDDPTETSRDALLKELSQLATYCGLTKRALEQAKSLSDVELKEYVSLQRRMAGGSLDTAALIADTEDTYAEFIHSELTKRKLGILEAKGHDFLRVAQHMSRVLGQDVAISGMRFRDYHEMLKHFVEHCAVIDGALSTLAAVLGIEIPNDYLLSEAGSTPVIPGQALSTKAAAYIINVVLNNIQFYSNHSAQMHHTNERLSDEVRKLTAQVAAAQEHERDTISRVEKVVEQVQASLNNVVTYVILRDKQFLAKKDPESKLSVKNLTFVDDLRDALFFNTRHSAMDLICRVDGRLGDLVAQRLVLASN